MELINGRKGERSQIFSKIKKLIPALNASTVSSRTRHIDVIEIMSEFLEHFTSGEFFSNQILVRLTSCFE
jgi:hypothetical protein